MGDGKRTLRGMADATARNQRLDALKASTTAWAAQERTIRQNTVLRCKAILKGRTGSERLASALSEATAAATQEEIDAFLSIDGE